MGVDPDVVAAVRAALREAADPAVAPGQQAYMKSALPYYGLAAPELKRLLRPHLAAYSPDDRESWEATLRALWDEATGKPSTAGGYPGPAAR